MDSFIFFVYEMQKVPELLIPENFFILYRKLQRSCEVSCQFKVIKKNKTNNYVFSIKNPSVKRWTLHAFNTHSFSYVEKRGGATSRLRQMKKTYYKRVFKLAHVHLPSTEMLAVCKYDCKRVVCSMSFKTQPFPRLFPHC